MSSVEEFRTGIRGRPAATLTGSLAGLRGRGSPGREHEGFAERLCWIRQMAAQGRNCLGRPEEHGGRGAIIEQQVTLHHRLRRIPRNVTAEFVLGLPEEFRP